MTAFFKISGAGNDFIALVEPSPAPTPATIEAWCRRSLSLGADGLFTLERMAEGARMVHFNADGGRSELCLNGSRCAAQLAFHLGWGRGEELLLKTDAGPLHAQRLDNNAVSLALPPGLVDLPSRLNLEVEGQSFEVWGVSVGVPHGVLQWPGGLANAPVTTLGPALRSHPGLGPAGANIHFVHFQGKDRFEIRSFERGVEAETLACGTGTVASVAVGLTLGKLTLSATAITAGGFELIVDGRFEDGRLDRARLGGDARLVAHGELLPGSMWIP